MSNDTVPAIMLRDVQIQYEHTIIMSQIHMSIPAGVMLAIVGPNGAGKSTLLKALVGLLPITSGTISFFGASYAAMRTAIAYVPQRMAVDWDFPITVLDVVVMGRYGKRGWFARVRQEDIDAALYALAQLDMAHVKDSPIGSLSGGQQQRVFIARALVQDAQLYVLDEPFVGIDMATEKKIMQVLHDLQKQGKTIVVVHHDMHAVKEHFDWIVLMNRAVIACGPTRTVLTADAVAQTYGYAHDRQLYHHFD